MIVATPLDLPIIKPDSWDVFWKIWRGNSDILRKVYSNVKTSPIKINSAAHVWTGLDIYRQESVKNTAYIAPFYDIRYDLPDLYKQIQNLPIDNIFRVRLITSKLNIIPHTDDNLDVWSIRAFFHYTSNEQQWFFTDPVDRVKKHYLKMPTDTNWFSYNDKYCWHGTDYDPDNEKILLQIYYAGKEHIVQHSIKKYKDYLIKI